VLGLLTAAPRVRRGCPFRVFDDVKPTRLDTAAPRRVGRVFGMAMSIDRARGSAQPYRGRTAYNRHGIRPNEGSPESGHRAVTVVRSAHRQLQFQTARPGAAPQRYNGAMSAIPAADPPRFSPQQGQQPRAARSGKRFVVCERCGRAPTTHTQPAARPKRCSEEVPPSHLDRQEPNGEKTVKVSEKLPWHQRYTPPSPGRDDDEIPHHGDALGPKKQHERDDHSQPD